MKTILDRFWKSLPKDLGKTTMGCDIHSSVEIRLDGIWQKVGDVFPYRYYDSKHPESEYNRPFCDRPTMQRNYSLFGILAGVRREGPPIVKPRGLPADVTEEVQKLSDDWGVDGHTHSWLSLQELLEYDWSQDSHVYTGYVTRDEFKIWRERGSPDCWCGGVGGGNVRTITNEQMQSLVDEDKKDHFDYYTEVEWTVKRNTYCKEFLEQDLPRMLALLLPIREDFLHSTLHQLYLAWLEGADNAFAIHDWLMERGLPSLDDVRVVFWFDN